eukprot:713382-Hanusia_phi.AAC.5
MPSATSTTPTHYGWKRCVPKSCGEYPVGTNMTAQPASAVVGGRVTLSCSEGFFLNGPGSPNPQCLYAGIYEEGQICSTIGCTTCPDFVDDPYTEPFLPVQNGTNRVSCLPGYKPWPSNKSFDFQEHCEANTTSYLLSCQNCTWWPSPTLSAGQRCRIQQCRPLTALDPYGITKFVSATTSHQLEPYFMDESILEYGDIIIVNCFPGFRANSSSPDAARSYNVTCKDSCKLAGIQNCTLVRCPLIEPPLHSSFNSSAELHHGDALRISCDLGYKVSGTSCAKEFDVTCSDGLLLGLKTCVPMQCGCGEAACQAFSKDAPPYDSFAGSWTPETSVSHGQSVEEGNFSDCSFDSSYTATCNDCTYQSKATCKKISCGNYEDWPLFNPGTMEVVAYEPAMQRNNISVGGVLVTRWNVEYDSVVSVRCKPGYRARIVGSSKVPSLQDPQSFEVTCTSTCAFFPLYECAMIPCAKFFSSGGTIGSSFDVPEGGLTEISCQQGFKVSGTSSVDCKTEIVVEQALEVCAISVH